jgi:hypothetical protein
MIRLKGSLAATLISTVIIGSFLLPVMVEGGITAGYTVQVSFFYPCVCTLTNVRVVVSDQSGRAVATAVSPDGNMLVITFRAETPEYWLLASASGYGSFSYNLPWLVHGSSIVTVQNIGGYYYATIYLTPSPGSIIFR